MKTWMLTLAMASVLVAQPVSADVGKMTITEFRQRNESQQLYMVLGAIALTSALDIACPQPVTIAEWRAGLVFRQVDVSQPWIAILMELMDERGCKGAPVKADT